MRAGDAEVRRVIPINLLPHRAERRKAQQRQFLALAGIVAAVGIAVVILVHGFFAQRIDTQNKRNKYLQDQIAVLEKQIDEIKKLREQTQAMLERKKVVESLQSNRTEAVRLLDQLVRQLPEGLYLKSVKQTNDVVNVVGYASSNARVSTLMRNFEASPWLEDPRLVEIKAVKVGSANLNEFNVNVRLTRAKEETPAAAPGAKQPAAPAAKSAGAAPSTKG
jgi:type IV pilus assembly protein PilN